MEAFSSITQLNCWLLQERHKTLSLLTMMGGNPKHIWWTDHCEILWKFLLTQNMLPGHGYSFFLTSYYTVSTDIWEKYLVFFSLFDIFSQVFLCDVMLRTKCQLFMWAEGKNDLMGGDKKRNKKKDQYSVIKIFFLILWENTTILVVMTLRAPWGWETSCKEGVQC